MNLNFLKTSSSSSCSFQGYDPLAKEKFVPRYKKKGRSSTGRIEKRKKQVAHEDQRVRSPQTWAGRGEAGEEAAVVLTLLCFQEVIKQTVEDRMKVEKERLEKEKKEASLSSHTSALDRFRK